MEDNIEIGDTVNVHIPNRALHNLKVLYIPTQPMDAWRLKNRTTGQIIQVLHYCTIEKLLEE